MTTHYLKVDERWLRRLRANQKHAEVRIDDRDFQTGDVIEFSHQNGSWTGVSRTISHVLRGADGIANGYVVLSLDDPRVAALAELRKHNETLVRSNRSLRARAKRLAQQVKS